MTPRSLSPRAAARASGLAALLALAACNGVQIKPQSALPDALVPQVPAKVGLVVSGDMRNFVHKETRWGVDWGADLGTAHQRWSRRIFEEQFGEIQEFASLEEAKAASGVKAIFEPRIEQFSFTTARETGRYYAVTIRYRIGLYTPDGRPVDTFTLTGYGNSLPRGASSTKPLQAATVAAMRDAAAKFLVQFPEQPVAQQLREGRAIEPDPAAAAGETRSASAASDGIEMVPIDAEAASQQASPGPAPGPAPPGPPESLPEPEQSSGPTQGPGAPSSYGAVPDA